MGQRNNQKNGQQKTGLVTQTSTRSVNNVDVEQLLVDVAILTGLLIEHDNTIELNSHWFDNPVANIQHSFFTHNDRLTDILKILLGEYSNNALGIPVKNNTLNGSWYPINHPETGQPTGLYIVHRTHNIEPQGQQQVYGLGVCKQKTLDTPESPSGSDKITLDCWFMVPLLATANESFDSVFATPDHPITLGVSVNAQQTSIKNGKTTLLNADLVEFANVSLGGATISCEVVFPEEGSTQEPYSFAIELLRLKLPGETKATDRSIAELSNITGEEFLQLAANLLLSLIDQQASNSKTGQYLMALTGLATTLPDIEDARLPSLNWVGLITESAQGVSLPKPITDWLNALLSDKRHIQSWLTALNGLLENNVSTLTKLNGAGSRTSPYTIPLFDSDTIGQLNLTLASEMNEQSVRLFYPGIQFCGSTFQIAHSGASNDTTAVGQFNANAELMQLSLSNTAAQKPDSITLSAYMVLRAKGHDKKLYESTSATATLKSLDRLQMGLELKEGMKIAPYFELLNVVTNSATYPSLNLLNPEQLLDKMADEICQKIEEQLDSLFGLNGDTVNFGRCLATLIGYKPPLDMKGANWPFSLPFSFNQPENTSLKKQNPLTKHQTVTGITSLDDIADSFSDPLGAIGEYYQTLLSRTSVDDGHTTAPFVYLISDFCKILQKRISGQPAVGVSNITGTGSTNDPWQMNLLSADVCPAYLQFSHQTFGEGTNTRQTLNIGLSAESNLSLSFNDSHLDFQLSAGITAAQFNFEQKTDGTEISCQWMPGLTAGFILPGTLNTSNANETQLSIQDLALSADWQTTGGFNWRFGGKQPTLIFNNESHQLADTLYVEKETNLDQLFIDSAARLATPVTRIIGTQLLRTDTRIATALAATFGFIPVTKQANDINGLNWQNAGEFPLLNLTNFSQPLNDIRQLWRTLLSNTAQTKALLGLWAYTLDNDLDTAPTIHGDGTTTSPWLMPLPLDNLALTVDISKQDNTVSQAHLGLMFNHTSTIEQAGHSPLDIQTRLTGQGLTLHFNDNDEFAGHNARLSWRTTLTRTGEHPLFNEPDTLSVTGMVVGFDLALTQGEPDITPVVELCGVTGFGYTDKNVNWEQLHDDAVPLLSNVLNKVASHLFDALKNNALFKDIHTLLNQLGLVLPDLEQIANMGIDPSGWRALSADPWACLSQSFNALMQHASTRKVCYDVLKALIPALPASLPHNLLVCLNALGLTHDASRGFFINLPALLTLIKAPLQTLSDSFDDLYSQADLLQRLTNQLQITTTADVFGPFSLKVDSELNVSLKTVNPVNLANLANFSLITTFNPTKATLDIKPTFYRPDLHIGLAPSVNLHYHTVNDVEVLDSQFDVYLKWGDGSTPQAPDFHLYTTASSGIDYTDQLCAILPVSTVSAFVTAVIEEQLLKPSQNARVIFGALGLAHPASSTTHYDNQQDRLKACHKLGTFNGLIADPAGWLLSDNALGQHGGFSVQKFTDCLKALTPASQPTLDHNTLALTNKTENGQFTVSLAGLPYQIAVNFAVPEVINEHASLSLGCAINNLDVSNDITIKQCQFALSLNSSFQPHVQGELAIQSGNLHFSSGYNETFTLAIRHQKSSPDGSTFSLQLLPFPGWQTLLNSVATTVIQQQLPTLMNGLLDGLASRDATLKNFTDSLKSLATTLDATTLCNNIATAVTSGNNLTDTALTWLLERFNATNAHSTVSGVVTLINSCDLPDHLSITQQSNLMVLNTNKDQPLGLLIKLGLNQASALGIWLEQNEPSTIVDDKRTYSSTLPKLVTRLRTIGVGYSINGADEPVSLTGGIDFLIPLDSPDFSPQLSLTLTSDSIIRVSFNPASTNSALNRELYPVFLSPDTSASIEQRVLNWLGLILNNVLPRYLSMVLLKLSPVKTALEQPIYTVTKDNNRYRPTLADLLTNSEILQRTTKQNIVSYQLSDLDTLTSIDSKKLIKSLLQTLIPDTVQLLSFQQGKGAVSLTKTSQGNTVWYGIDIAVRDINAGNHRIQLGSTDKTWLSSTFKSSLTTPVSPGIAISIPFENNELNVNALRVNIDNLGIDFRGKASGKLIQSSRFSLKSLDIRLIKRLNFGSPDKDKFAIGVTCHELGLPLSTSTITHSSGNKVAANLLGSGKKTGRTTPRTPGQKGTTHKGKNNNATTNPAFTLRAFHAEGDDLDIKLLDSKGKEVDELWQSVQRNFGPLQVSDIGVGWQNSSKKLSFLFNGGVHLAGLQLDLQELSVSMPVTTATDLSTYTLGLEGIDISYSGGPVQLSAALLEDKTNPQNIVYSGSASLKASKFSLDAIGSYQEIALDDDPDNTAPSLFVFGRSSIPLGGIPAFFVTGIAAGLSYNRNLTVPTVDTVEQFPLINPDALTSSDPLDALTALKDYVQPEVGEYWLAAGVTAESFKLIETNALFFVKFGHTFEIDMVGLSALTLPKRRGKSTRQNKQKALVDARLGIVATIKPEEGVVGVEAQLAPGSFILNQNCHLTGGFASYLWFAGEHSGQFVVSLGGYHPDFKAPDFYPVVPRVGFNWRVSDAVAITGESYFALTPAAIMSGGLLKASLKAGGLKAWFECEANLLIAWQPFYFEADVHVVVGASYTFKVLGVSSTVGVEIGAGLELYGPPLAGKVDVDWTIIAFSIEFGEQEENSKTLLNWQAFSDQFLPAPYTDDNNVEHSSVIKFTVETGQLPNPDITDKTIRLDSSAFSLNVESTIPFSSIEQLPNASYPSAGIQPMGVTTLSATGSVTLNKLSGADLSDETAVSLTQAGLTLSTVAHNAPKALWSREPFDMKSPPAGDDITIRNAVMGIQLSSGLGSQTDKTGPLTIDNNTVEKETVNTAFDSQLNNTNTAFVSGSLGIIQSSLMENDTVSARDSLLHNLNQAGFELGENSNLSTTAADINDLLTEPPLLVNTGEFLTPAPTEEKKTFVQPTSLAATNTKTTATHTRIYTLDGVSYRYDHATDLACAVSPLLSKQRQSCQYLSREASRHTINVIQQEKTLHRGSTQLWSINGSALSQHLQQRQTFSLSNQGDLQLGLSGFDENGGLLLYRTVNSQQTTELSVATRQLAIKGITANVSGNIAGWSLDSRVLKLNDFYYQSGDVLIRTQNRLNTQRYNTPVQQGYFDLKDILEGNQIQADNGTHLPGVLETLTYTPASTLVIVVNTNDSTTAANAISVHWASAESPEQLTANQSLTAPTVVNQTDSCALLFDLSTLNLHTLLNISIQPHAQNTLLALGFSQQNLASVQTSLSTLSLKTNSVPLSDHAAQVTSQVHFSPDIPPINHHSSTNHQELT